MESRPPDTSPSTRSSDWLPEWANPVTLRGLILLLAGVLILAIPDATRGLLSLIVQIGLILGGLTTVWGALRRSGLRLVELLIGVAMTLAGLALAVWPDATARVVSGVIGAVGVMLG
ncbi:MAG: DUF308 domain-containing protein, partial [Acidimicrobiia bacterium]|nr:DUF308 domain-containing protein [Acidimicrobiia bacterium]